MLKRTSLSAALAPAASAGGTLKEKTNMLATHMQVQIVVRLSVSTTLFAFLANLHFFLLLLLRDGIIVHWAKWPDNDVE